MLLTEYDEQAHIDSEKEIAREEGVQKGKEKINMLYQKLKADNRMEDLLKAIDNAEYQNLLLEQYGL